MYDACINRVSGKPRGIFMGQFRQVFPWLVLAIITVGCSSGPVMPSLGKVSGTITLDGEPAEGLTVTFVPDHGRSSFAKSDEDGNYTLEFDDKNQGAVIGKHKVEITKRMEGDPAKLAAGGGPPKLIPPRYNTQTTLEADVKAGENDFNFDVKTQL